MNQLTDPDEAATNSFDPLVARPIDLPTQLPLGGPIDPAIGDIAKIFAAPDDPAEWPQWRAALMQWRVEARERLHYQGGRYDDDRLRWAAHCYNVALAWLWDERLFDHSTQRFTVQSYLEGCSTYGRVNGVVLWHAYPVIGIDDRNQFDFYRLVPGVQEVVSEFQAAGVRVFINYNPWDTGTRRADGDDPAELAALVEELGVDGVFLDTMKEGGTELIAALAEKGQVLEGESRIQLSRVEDHQLSWAQWFADSAAPGVLRAHWYEQRHMMHSTRRWNRDHSAELQTSFMNGTGMLIWDTVFGVWVGWNQRDRATLRAMSRIQKVLGPVFSEGEWTPLVDAVPEAIAAGVYVSRFERGREVLWTVINRAQAPYSGQVLTADALEDRRVVDLLGRGSTEAGIVTIPARGIAALYAHDGAAPDWLDSFLSYAETNAGDLTADDAFEQLPQRRVDPPASGNPPSSDAVALTEGIHKLTVEYRRRETGLYFDAPYVEEWKPLPPRLHDDRQETFSVTIGRVAVAATEVTRAEFARFVTETGYQPLHQNRFMDWDDQHDDAPATYVGLTDARAYARWAGARLPTEHEWQLASTESSFARLKPWVWNWTESEHTDTVTRFVILKGGSDYAPEGSDWYFDGGRRSGAFSAKLLLAGAGMERSPFIGFRLAWDGPR
ncbi:hypothetical protein BJ994_001772 [Arthrobacter pigmenti]|uniref:Sulfatase-modifying factor enzyme-like domain-containing protein n=1 Tax=Arthrobacter pigmenti TaxID=271432 RepID=A0A846RUI5_9MICC|nr:SUMF1/EgtB/PvdO family nonheme iron enzyme [Arthrobacter pigmenti]NJC22696.1 hypothetical protein [Arthrobacter pigmenti]